MNLRTSGHAARMGLAVLALAGLSACGSESNSTSANGTVAVTSYPAAEVFLDGVSQGMSPKTLSVAAGAHKVRFAAAGFQDDARDIDVSAGKTVEVEGSLAVKDPNDPVAHDALATALGIPLEPASLSSHRGAKATGVLPMFPAGEMRKAGLSRFRIETDAEFETAGKLEFRVGHKVLWSKPFNPESLVEVQSIPAEVMKALKNGDRIEWGFYPDNPKIKPVVSQFHLIDKPQVDKAVAQIDGDKRLAKQPPLVRELLKAEKMENYSLFAEALLKYLDIHATYPDTSLPYKGIVNCLQRLKLTESTLYADALSKKPAEKSPTRPARADLTGGTGADLGRGTGAINANPPSIALSAMSSGPGFGGQGGAPTNVGPAPAPIDFHSGAKPPTIEGNSENAGGGPVVKTPVGGTSNGASTGESTGGTSTGQTPGNNGDFAAAQLKAQDLAFKAKQAQIDAALAHDKAKALQDSIQQLQAQINAASNELGNTTPGTPEHQAAIDALNGLQQKLLDTQKAQIDAEAAARAADDAALNAQIASDKAAAELVAIGNTGGAATQPSTQPKTELPAGGLNALITSAKDEAAKAQALLASLNGALQDAAKVFAQVNQAQADWEAAVQKAANSGDPADQTAAEALHQQLLSLQQKSQQLQSAFNNKSAADRLQQAIDLAGFAKSWADQAAQLALLNPNNPDALALAQEAATRAADAAKMVEQLLAGLK